MRYLWTLYWWMTHQNLNLVKRRMLREVGEQEDVEEVETVDVDAEGEGDAAYRLRWLERS
jgi:hypothetical protein